MVRGTTIAAAFVASEALGFTDLTPLSAGGGGGGGGGSGSPVLGPGLLPDIQFPSVRFPDLSTSFGAPSFGEFQFPEINLSIPETSGGAGGSGIPPWLLPGGGQDSPFGIDPSDFEFPDPQIPDGRSGRTGGIFGDPAGFLAGQGQTIFQGIGGAVSDTAAGTASLGDDVVSAFTNPVTSTLDFGRTVNYLETGDPGGQLGLFPSAGEAIYNAAGGSGPLFGPGSGGGGDGSALPVDPVSEARASFLDFAGSEQSADRIRNESRASNSPASSAQNRRLFREATSSESTGFVDPKSTADKIRKRTEQITASGGGTSGGQVVS